MRDSTPRVARSYDELVRSTVPDPDGSKRPTARQEQVAREGHCDLDAHERALRARIVEALEDVLRSSNEVWSFEIDIDGDTAILHGHVHDRAMIGLVEATVENIEGVVQVVNQLVGGHRE